MNIVNSIPEESRTQVLVLLGVTAALLTGLIIVPCVMAIVRKIHNYRQAKLEGKAAQEQYENVMRTAATLSRNLSDLLAHNIDPLDLIVQFFSMTSPVSDKMPFGSYQIEQYLTNEQKKRMDMVCSVIGNMGRCNCGINRTKESQTVTASDVYLGNICGIWTKTVSYWKVNRHLLTGLHKDTYQILQAQARGFMESNTNALKKSLTVQFAS